MKNIALLCVFSCVFTLISAQSDTISWKYCKVMGVYSRVVNTEVTAYIDSGQTAEFKEKVYKNNLGTDVVFKSDIAVVNFMAKKKWQLYLVVNAPDNSGRTIYIMRKRYNY